jgi:N-acetylglucosaminyldiphosphoundecaprenol N-acetyl-beta-D-mannosaminyltransferase
MHSVMGSPNKIERVNVLGVGVSAINLEMAKRILVEAVRQKAKGYVCVTGVHGVMEAQADPRFRAILNHALLCTPDGMPMVWMGKLNRFRKMGRVYGPDLMLEMCAAPDCRHFLYGGANGAAQSLQKKLEASFPAINIVGFFEPPWRPLNSEEEQKLCRLIAETQPDIMWIGLSTPKQEKFMADYLPKLEVTLMIGVGAAFDFLSGRGQQAPRWMQQTGLEWFYRLCREPRRLWRRYLKNNPRFVYAAGCQLLGLKKFPLE